MLKKIQNYLLQNHPLFWQTKFFQMMTIGLFLWLLSFLLAYATVNIYVLQTQTLQNLYFTNAFIFHLLIGVIIYIVWALYFFRTNAIKHLYPVSKFYMHKVLLQIFLPALLICSLYYPYTYGCYIKTKAILSEADLKKEARIINLAYPFLVYDIGNYSITNRIYPSPFPLACFSKDEANADWKGSQGLYFHPKLTNGDIDSAQENYSPKSADPILSIGTGRYLFYKSHTLTVGKDSCHQHDIELIDSFIKPSISHLENNYLIQNYSQITINNDFVYNADLTPQDVYKKEIAPTVFRWTENKNTDSIKLILDNFKTIADKYRIENYLPINKIIKKISDDNFAVHDRLTSNNKYDFEKIADPDAMPLLAQEQTVTSDVASTNNNAVKAIAYVDMEGVNRIFSNYEYAINNNFQQYMLFAVFVLIAIFMLLIALAYWLELVPFLISIPVLGAIIILMVLFQVISGNADLTVFYFLVSTLLVGMGWLATKQKSFSKTVSNIIAALSFYALGCFSFCLFILIHQFSKYYTTHCWQQIEHYGYEINEWHVLLLYIVLFILMLPILKKIRAKEE